MMFHGFNSVREYEREARKHGFITESAPFQRGNERFFVLITRTGTGSGVASWHLFPLDESREIMDGVINGVDSNYLGKLADAGYFPVEEAPEDTQLLWTLPGLAQCLNLSK